MNILFDYFYGLWGKGPQFLWKGKNETLSADSFLLGDITAIISISLPLTIVINIVFKVSEWIKFLRRRKNKVISQWSRLPAAHGILRRAGLLSSGSLEPRDCSGETLYSWQQHKSIINRARGLWPLIEGVMRRALRTIHLVWLFQRKKLCRKQRANNERSKDFFSCWNCKYIWISSSPPRKACWKRAMEKFTHNSQDEESLKEEFKLSSQTACYYSMFNLTDS